jgi:hypothetical protein
MIRSQRAAVREALLEALDGWARAALGLTKGEPLFARYLMDVAQQADENAWRRNVRQWFLERNADELAKAAEEALKSRQPPATIELLAWTLYSRRKDGQDAGGFARSHRLLPSSDRPESQRRDRL